MTDSILTTTKKALGLDAEYTDFDMDITMHINSVLATLHQLGVGPEDGFMISDASQTWTQLFGNVKILNLVKSYVYLQVRLIFDPPATSFAIDSFQKIVEEYAWRITLAAESVTFPPTPIPEPEPDTVIAQNFDGSSVEGKQVIITLTEDSTDIHDITVGNI